MCGSDQHDSWPPGTLPSKTDRPGSASNQTLSATTLQYSPEIIEGVLKTKPPVFLSLVLEWWLILHNELGIFAIRLTSHVMSMTA